MTEHILSHKHTDERGDIVEMRIWKVPASGSNPEGISYSLVYIRNGKRIVGYDNEGHGKPGRNHHRHLRERTAPYDFVDVWKLVEDFAEDVEKIRRGVIP